MEKHQPAAIHMTGKRQSPVATGHHHSNNTINIHKTFIFIDHSYLSFMYEKYKIRIVDRKCICFQMYVRRHTESRTQADLSAMWD